MCADIGMNEAAFCLFFWGGGRVRVSKNGDLSAFRAWANDICRVNYSPVLQLDALALLQLRIASGAQRRGV